MAVPKKKLPRHRVRKRRSAWVRRAQAPNLVPCTRCHHLKLPHHVCPFCGYYKNQQVLPEKDLVELIPKSGEETG